MEVIHENWSCHKDVSKSSWLTMGKNPKCKHDPKDTRVLPKLGDKGELLKRKGKGRTQENGGTDTYS